MADEPAKPGATGGASPAPGEKGASGSGSPAEAELQAENKRKADEITQLKTDRQRDQEKIKGLEKAKEDEGLTDEEEDQLDDLQKSVAEKAAKLREHKDAKPWEHMWKEDSAKNSADAVLNNEVQRANDFLEDKAFEEGYAKDGMSASELEDAVERFARDVSPHTRNFNDRRPERRNQLGYRAWKAEQGKLNDLTEREKKLKENEDNAQRFRETGSRAPRDQKLEDKLKSSSSGNETSSAIRDLIPTAVPLE